MNMSQNNIKTAYQNSKIAKGNITDERLLLGKREIQTLKLLTSEIGYESRSKKILLDLGCADRFLQPACKSENWIYWGLDYTDVDFEFGTYPIEDNSVDIAVSLAVIEHLRDPENFISEVYRCVKPGELSIFPHPTSNWTIKISIMILPTLGPTRLNPLSNYSNCQGLRRLQVSQAYVAKISAGIAAKTDS